MQYNDIISVPIQYLQREKIILQNDLNNFFFIDILNPEFEKILLASSEKITTGSIRNSGQLEIKMIKSIDINEDIVPCKVFWITYIIALSKDRSLN